MSSKTDTTTITKLCGERCTLSPSISSPCRLAPPAPRHSHPPNPTHRNTHLYTTRSHYTHLTGTNAMSPNAIPNTALATALTVYPLLTRLSLPPSSSPSATPNRFILTREAISAIHSALISCASAAELYRQHDKWLPHGSSPTSSSPDEAASAPSSGSRPPSSVIDAQSTIGRALIAWECGYLFADFAVLVLGARHFRRQQSNAHSKSVLARSVNWRVMGWHHLGIGVALALYHIHGLRGPTKGVMVMLIMLLMNTT